MILRSRFVLPICSPPIENGAVAIAGDRIGYVGPFRSCPGISGTQVFDLGDSVLLPGLINAHCHLDYTGMAGLIAPQKTFTDWIAAILALKAHWSYTDYANSWLRGARMLLRKGVTTVGDIEAVPELLPEVKEATPLRVLSFIEMTGVKSQRPAQLVLQEALDQIQRFGGSGVGLSPHSPYSTSAELLRLAGRTARQRGWRTATHVAESREEWEMFVRRSGPLFDWLRHQRDMSDCRGATPVHHLDACGMLGDSFLAIHANYLSADDVERLARSGTSVVHCPRSHDYFQHQRFPWEELHCSGVNLCLGTDSLATVLPDRREPTELDLFLEMRLVHRRYGLAPEAVVRSATMNGAKALGFGGMLGELSSNTLADLIAVPFEGRGGEVFEAVVHHTGDVTLSMIHGRWAVKPDWLEVSE